jgi:hypothetical protein
MYRLSFPNNRDAEDYELDSYEELQETVKKELRQSIEDMGSDGYDLDWGNGEYDPVQFEKLPIAEQEERTMAAHALGVDKAVDKHFPGTFAELMSHNEVKLPDGTWLRLVCEDVQHAS